MHTAGTGNNVLRQDLPQPYKAEKSDIKFSCWGWVERKTKKYSSKGTKFQLHQMNKTYSSAVWHGIYINSSKLHA
jgi:hypothetical protein